MRLIHHLHLHFHNKYTHTQASMAVRHRHQIPVCLLPRRATTVTTTTTTIRISIALLLLLSVVLNASLFLSHLGVLDSSSGSGSGTSTSSGSGEQPSLPLSALSLSSSSSSGKVVRIPTAGVLYRRDVVQHLPVIVEPAEEIGPIRPRTPNQIPTPTPPLHLVGQSVVPPPTSTSSIETSSIETATTTTTIVEEDVPLPLWMTEYLSWHREQRRTLTPQNWQYTADSADTDTDTADTSKTQTETNTNTNTKMSRKYLVVRCLRHDVPCGGLSDRLRHLPLALWIASQTNRLLLIHWELPAPLEEFLVPPPPPPPSFYNNSTNDNDSSSNSNHNRNSLDWRIPSWLLEQFQFANRPTVTKVPDIPAAFLNTKGNNSSNRILLDMRLQSYKEASVYYNTHAVSNSTPDSTESSSPDFNTVFRPVWNLLFTPSPAVADLLARHLQRMHLRPGQYVAAHTRTLYHFNLTGSDLQSTVENAINCAAQLYEDSSSNNNSNRDNISNISNNTATGGGTTPTNILVASDSLAASQLAVAYGRGRVVSQQSSTFNDTDTDGTGTPGTLAAAAAAAYQTPLHLDREADFLQHHEPRGVLLQHHQAAVAAAAAVVAANTTAAAAAATAALPARAYYNVFVDLYLLANSRCVTYDRGGFGKLGSLLSTNASCFVRHKTNKCRPRR